MSTTKQRAAARAKVGALLATYRAMLVTHSDGLEWILTTPHGPLSVALWQDDDASNIFMRWCNGRDSVPAVAWEAGTSSKWNIHAETAAQALAELDKRLRRIGCAP